MDPVVGTLVAALSKISEAGLGWALSVVFGLIAGFVWRDNGNVRAAAQAREDKILDAKDKAVEAARAAAAAAIETAQALVRDLHEKRIAEMRETTTVMRLDAEAKRELTETIKSRNLALEQMARTVEQIAGSVRELSFETKAGRETWQPRYTEIIGLLNVTVDGVKKQSEMLGSLRGEIRDSTRRQAS